MTSANSITRWEKKVALLHKDNKMKQAKQSVESQPVQLDLFQTLINNDFSNSVELYASLPDVFSWKQDKLRNADGSLPALTRNGTYKNTPYSIDITPANVTVTNPSTWSKTKKAFYKTVVAEFIENALQKLAVWGGFFHENHEHDKNRFSLITTYYQVREELKRVGKRYSYEQIKEGIAILAWLRYELNGEISKAFDISSYLIEYESGDRLDNFRADQRIPWRFRASLGAYKDSGFDRGHLAPSANLSETVLQNSETFLLSNMSPQAPNFNRIIWRKLEEAVRELDSQSNIMETYVLTAPYFDFDKKIETIGDRHAKHGIDIPIPHGFIKSIFAERKNGSFGLWTFKMENKASNKSLGDFLVKTYDAEQYVGGRFWDRVSGGDLHNQKKKAGKMWKTSRTSSGKISKAKLNRMPEADVVEIAIGMGLNASVNDKKSDTIAKILERMSA